MVNINSLVSDIRKGLVTANTSIVKLSQPAAFRATYDTISRDFNASAAMVAEVQGALAVAYATIPLPADLPLRVQLAGETTATLVRQLQDQQTRLGSLNDQLNAALGQSSGVPSWVLYAGGAIAAVAIFLGLKRKK